MTTTPPRPSSSFPPGFFPTGAIALTLIFAGCSAGGSSSSSGGGVLSSFALASVNIQPNQTWQINRPIVFTFTKDVDFVNSVSGNTIDISTLGGTSALGRFFLLDSRKVVFQPRCPTRDDLSDSGLLPGGVTYQINVLSGANGGNAVQSMTGEAVAQSAPILFETPVSGLPADLFLDPVPGGPQPLVWDPNSQTVAEQEGHSYLELGGDPTNRVYFRFDPSTALGSLPDDVPLNLYSDTESQFSVILEFDQPVDPATTNIAETRVCLEFQEASGLWRPFSSVIELDANCFQTAATESGARLRVTPSGILPQNRPVRVRITSEFQDIIGNRNQVALTSFANMRTIIAPGAGAADETLEDFLLAGVDEMGLPQDSNEDTEAVFAVPQANWGDGNLSAAFEFAGNGGPNGDFDWILPPNQVLSLDTSVASITGGPGGVPTTTQIVVGGNVNVRDFIIPEGTTLRVQGINPLTVLASGTVRIDGNLFCNGAGFPGVVTLNTNFIPETGAAGTAGGGRGGSGSPGTNAASPRGQSGFGAGDMPGGGGQGGESGFNTGSTALRRPGGGGGGVFGEDIFRDGDADCPEQIRIGTDAESGFNGAPESMGAVSGEAPANGGARGLGPFFDSSDENNFWGTMVANAGIAGEPGFEKVTEQLIVGELLAPSAGTGGGGGGDSYNSAIFPPLPWNPFGDDKGGGGGGGGGSITILALGNIDIGPQGFITANGGVGGGGENTGGVNRVGGGSGGGSGGHIVLQTASQILMNRIADNQPHITAFGGQGGSGRNDQGGAKAGGNPTSAAKDSIPREYMCVCSFLNCTGNNGADPCDANGGSQICNWICAGGDGGPGVLQLHAPTLDDIIAPFGNQFSPNHSQLRATCLPRPMGFDSQLNNGTFVDQMIPIFGRFSQARSKWIDLGQPNLDPITTLPGPIAFSFGGTDTTNPDPDQRGFVLASGNLVSDAAAILPIVSLVSPPGVPSFDPDQSLVVMDASPLIGANEIYKRNANLLNRYSVEADTGSTTVKFLITSATYDAANDQLRLIIQDDGSAGAALGVGNDVTVIPHFFRVVTNEGVDELPESATIRIEFQASAAGPGGAPDESSTFPGVDTWAQDINDLNGAPVNSSFRFVRFQVSFDILATGGQLGFDTPRPSLEFLRVPLGF